MIWKSSPVILSALMLVACGAEESQPVDKSEDLVPDKITQAVLQSSHRVILSGKGLNAGGEPVLFGTAKSVVEASLSKALGAATETGANGECGAGPMEFSTYPGGLTANFQDGKLVGWSLNRERSERIETDKGIQIGSPIKAFQESHLAEYVDDSTLGPELYSSRDGIGAMAMEGEVNWSVDSLFAGTNCSFR